MRTSNWLLLAEAYALFLLKKLATRRLTLLLLLAGLLGAASMTHAAEDYLEPDVAFKISASMYDVRTVSVSYEVAEGYYLYKERFQFKANGATLGSPAFPEAKVKFDETFRKNVETFRHTGKILLPVSQNGNFALTIVAQGCADLGLCYAPMESTVQILSFPIAAISTDESASASTKKVALNSQSGDLQHVLQAGRLLSIIPLFLLLGAGLSLTPCVLPMIPILSSIILGEGQSVSRGRGFLLSAAYSLGMATIYTVMGVAAGLAGVGLAATLQNPWIVSAFAILMGVIALSMFDVFNLTIPQGLQNKLIGMSSQRSGGKIIGVFLMGAISALIVGPCVAAPLASALVYISQTRDAFLGGVALFSLAIGMSVPLLLIGVSAGSLLPRTGQWMVEVKRLFGVIICGVALWMLIPVLPVAVQMLAWATLGFGYGAYLMWAVSAGWVFKAIGLMALSAGLLQLVGVASGSRDVLQPLAHGQRGQENSLPFKRIKSVSELDAALAANLGKTIMLDFYADWCVACKEMEKLTFSDPSIQQKLGSTVLLQADVTANDGEDKALLKRFQLFGPPGIILFDKQGKEIFGGRIIGYQNAAKFASSIAVLDAI
jgi:thiol:disulfide interchange protein DsbD